MFAKKVHLNRCASVCVLCIYELLREWTNKHINIRTSQTVHKLGAGEQRPSSYVWLPGVRDLHKTNRRESDTRHEHENAVYRVVVVRYRITLHTCVQTQMFQRKSIIFMGHHRNDHTTRYTRVRFMHHHGSCECGSGKDHCTPADFCSVWDPIG